MKPPGDFSAEDRLAAGWIHKMATAQPEALNSLYGLYHRPLFSLIQSILKDPFASEEVLQDTFVRAYRQAARYDPEIAVPFAWLATIGKRLAIDFLRKRRSRPEFLSDNREQLENSADKESDTNEGRLDTKLEADWIRDRLRFLSPAQYEAIELAFFEGYTHNEIAEKLDKPLGTVKSDLARGLMQLRKAYLEQDD